MLVIYFIIICACRAAIKDNPIIRLPAKEINALKSIFDSLNGSFWKNNQNWSFENTSWNGCSGLYGVNCTIGDVWQSDVVALHVISIKLSGNKLKGSISSAIGDLSSLIILSLQSNSISGIIPTTLASLKSLQALNLTDNPLDSDISNVLSMDLPVLLSLDLSATKIQGTIPSTINKLSSLTIINLQNNSMNGTLPNTIGSLRMLKNINLFSNSFSGPIPSSLKNVSGLEFLSVHTNCLSGSIPHQIGSLNKLSYLSLYKNSLTGSIPSSLGRLSLLIYLALYSNKLTSTIPTSLGKLKNMQFLRFYENSLVGSIPSSLTAMNESIVFRLDQNQLTGSLPSFGNMSKLVYFDCSVNSLSGTLPTSFGSLKYGVVNMFFFNNRFSGSIPEEWGTMNPQNLRLDQNRLTGTFPTSFASMSALKVLLLNNNNLDGTLDNAFQPLIQTNLQNVDLSNNAFSGSIPGNVFRCPSLVTFASTQNCFYGSIPDSICNATNLEVLTIAGLRGGQACQKTIDLVYMKPVLTQAMAGGIPMCVWSMKNLTNLQMSGNGLSGKLVSPPAYSKLGIVRMSGNKINGTAPAAFQTYPFTTLDLENNKIGGTWGYLPHNFNTTSSALYLAVNRLSGNLPLDLTNAEQISVLSGNVFSCSELPENDPNAGSYVCASSGYDSALNLFGYVMLGVFVCLLVYIGFDLVRFRLDKVPASQKKEKRKLKESKNEKDLKLQNDSKLQLHISMFKLDKILFDWFTSVGTNIKTSTYNFKKTKYTDNETNTQVSEDFPNIQGFVDALRLHRRTAAMMMSIIIFVCVPLYPLLKSVINNGAAQMIEYQYNWKMSGVFLSGLGPALLLFFLWITIVVLYTLMCSYYHITSKIPEEDNNTKSDACIWIILRYLLIFVVLHLDVVCVLAENVGFVYLLESNNSPSVKTATQFAKPILDMTIDALFRLALVDMLPDKRQFAYWRGFMIIFNSVLAPIIIILVYSEACFKDLFVPPPPVTTTYSFYTCIYYTYDVLDKMFYCKTFGYMNVASTYQPAFVYNNTCSASLFTSYIPAVLYGYVLSGFVVPWFFFILPAMVEKTTIARMLCESDLLMMIFPGLLWPSGGKPCAGKELLIPAADVLVLFVKDFTMLLTFGSISPPLAVCIFGTIVFKSVYFQTLIGRFVGASKSNALLMEEACHQTHDIPVYCISSLVASSALFYCAVVFDMMIDKVALFQAFWPSLIIIIFANVTKFITFQTVKRIYDEPSDEKQSKVKKGGESSCFEIKDEENTCCGKTDETMPLLAMKK